MNKDLERLKQAVADSTITKVAKKIGVSRTAISLLVNDKYTASPDHIINRFNDAFGAVVCPHLNAEITRQECKEFSTKNRPSNPLGLSHWKACAKCSFKEV